MHTFTDIRPQEMSGAGVEEMTFAPRRRRMASAPRPQMMDATRAGHVDNGEGRDISCGRIGVGIGGALIAGGSIAGSYLAWAALTTPTTGLCVGVCVILRAKLFICGAVKVSDQGMGCGSLGVGAAAVSEVSAVVCGVSMIREAVHPSND